MTKKILVCYWFKNISSPKRHQFHRELFGAIEKTHKGKYTAITKGYLYNKFYERPIKSMVVIARMDKLNVLKIVRKYKGQYRVFKVIAEE